MLSKWLIALLIVSAVKPALAAPTQLQSRIDSVLKRPRSGIVSVVIEDLRSGELLASEAPRLLLKPASVLKILTAAAAFETLGPHFRFSTEVRYEGKRSGHISTLYIRGGADPSLTTEATWLLARKVYKKGIETIDSLVLDDSGFSVPRARVGQRAYETGSSPLALSFNSVAFDVCPGSVGSAASLMPDPWEADVVTRGSIKTVSRGAGQFAIDEISSLGAQFEYQLSGTFGASRTCETIYRSVRNPLKYFGSVFSKFLTGVGVRLLKAPKIGNTPPSAALLFEQRSKPLSLIVEEMNLYSTNFIAEQIVYALGEKSRFFDREKGLERVRDIARLTGFTDEDFVIVDGSGLSHENRLSSAVVAEVLRRASLDLESGIEFQKSLSVSEANGTLKDRRFGNGVVVRGKTGTLDGVSSLAGIVRSQSGREVVFSIIQNGVPSKERASQLEDAIVAEIYRSV